MAEAKITKSDFLYIIAILIAAMLWFIDTPFGFKFNGLDFANWPNINFGRWGLSFLTLFGIFILFLYLSKRGEFILKNKSTILLIIQLVIYVLLGATKNTGAFLHILLAPFVVYLVEQSEKFFNDDNIKTLNWLLFTDFVVLPAVEALATAGFGSGFVLLRGIRYFAHPYVLYTVGSSITRVSTPWLKVPLTIFLLFFCTAMFVSVTGGNLYIVNNIDTADLKNFLAATTVFKDAATFWTNFSTSIATGIGTSWNSIFNMTDPYSGEPEKSDNPQGVFLEKVDRGELTYREEMPVYVSATVIARTLEKPMNVKVSCNTTIEENDKEISKQGIVNEENEATEIELPVFSGAERTVTCMFDSLPEGEYDIVFKAEFEFAADSTHKIYMMERERMLNDFLVLNDKGQEPTKENILSVLYDIQDTKPESIYTTGPIELAIGTDKLPWDLATDNNYKPLFGLTVKNLWSEGGQIEKINAVYLKVPRPMTVQKNTCTGIPLEIMSSQDVQEKEGGYIVYKLDPKIGEVKDQVTLGCYIVADNTALDPVPVTTRYLKAHVDYTYMLTEKITIDVEEVDLGSEAEELMERSLT